MTDTTELPAPPDGHTAYGITIYCIGDDGDSLVAFGHLDKRRFFAACNNFARNHWSLRNLADDHDTTWADIKNEITHIHARYVTNPEDPEHDWEVWWAAESEDEFPIPITVWETR